VKSFVLKENKITIKSSVNNGQEDAKEFVLGTPKYSGEPESVQVGVGITVSPRQYESIRIDYHCTIHHEPGQKYREDAFALAQQNCLSRVVDDVRDLHQSGVISDHFLLPKE